MRQWMVGKLHCVQITGKELDYHGSITIDKAWMDIVGIRKGEFVEIYNKSTGSRINTYVIEGVEGSRECQLNGPAALSCSIGDELVIVARAWLMEQPTVGEVVVFGKDNSIIEVFNNYE